ncbi:hypothetical protein KKG90_11205 [Candidatus Bipolaricaulota bacterium]|nr:hypothetical protein [Candidatus Bipolaricaulota bacterium]
MKNALILTGVWLGILVTAYAVVYWDKGIDRPLPISVLEQQIRTTASEYVHPDGLFSVTPPMGWQVINDADAITMTDPNANIDVWILVMDAAELDVVLSEAFLRLDLGEDYTKISSVSMPMGAWQGDDVSVTYRSESTDDVVLIRAQRPDEWTIVLLARGPERALEALSENIDWIWTEMRIPADTPKLL